MTKLLTAEEAHKSTFLKVEYSMQQIDRLWMVVKKDLADRGKVVLQNTVTREDEILDWNCHLCDKVGNCLMHKGTYIIGDCHHLEYKEGWEEVG